MFRKLKLLAIIPALFLCFGIPGTVKAYEIQGNIASITDYTVAKNDWSKVDPDKFNQGDGKENFGGVIGPDAGALKISEKDAQVFANGVKVDYDNSLSNVVVTLANGLKVLVLVDGQTISKEAFVASKYFKFSLGWVSADLGTPPSNSIYSHGGNPFLIFMRHSAALQWVPAGSTTAMVGQILFKFDFMYSEISREQRNEIGQNLKYWNFDTPRVDAVMSGDPLIGSLAINLSPRIRFNGYKADANGNFQYIKGREGFSEKAIKLFMNNPEYSKNLRVYSECNAAVAFFRWLCGARTVADFKNNLPIKVNAFEKIVCCDFAVQDRTILKPYLLHPYFENLLKQRDRLQIVGILLDQYFNHNRDSKYLFQISKIILEDDMSYLNFQLSEYKENNKSLINQLNSKLKSKMTQLTSQKPPLAESEIEKQIIQYLLSQLPPGEREKTTMSKSVLYMLL